MPKVDPALEVLAVGRHVLQADRVVEAPSGTPDGRDHEVAGSQEGDIWSNGFDLAEALVANDQEVIPLGRRAVFSRVDFAVGAVHADPKDLDQDAAAVSDI